MMKSTNFAILLISVTVFPLLFTLSQADLSYVSSIPTAPKSVCNATLYPQFCKSMLRSNDDGANIREYGRFSLRRSLSAAKKFLKLVNKYLRRRERLTKTAVAALEDCQLLAGLNIDFLKSTMLTLNTTRSILSSESDDLQTLLSAIVTNQQTCSDGIEATAKSWSLKGGMFTPLENGTKLYSVSLSLITRGWAKKKKKKCKSCDREERKLAFLDTGHIRQGPLKLRMSNSNREVFETFSRRKPLEASESGGDDVLVSGVVIVSQNGTGNYTTIGEAVEAAPNNTVINDGYFLIYVAGGVYEEYVLIGKHKKYVMMIGDGINETVITGNRSFIDGWTTFNSATFAVVGEGFVAVNITFCNTAGPIKHQAVAVRNGADLSCFYSCSFEGYQDTLYTHSLRQFYRDCYIYGTVDFIFGNAAVVFQNCMIYARLPMEKQFNAVTAQGRTDPFQNTGISIHNCSIIASPELAKSNYTTNTYLGRPWKAYSRTVYIQSRIDKFVHPKGWTPWLGDFALNTSYYAEFNNTGRGSKCNRRVKWKGYHSIGMGNVTEMYNFTVSSFIMGDDWLPSTGVSYVGGLLN